MSTFVIGDIHGCWSELEELLARAGVGDGDEIVALGDIVDRGPDTPRVLEFFRRDPRARSLKGNHERKHVLSARGDIRPALSQQITRRQIGEGAYPDAVEFMDSMPNYVETPEAILVHGFWEPGVLLDKQHEKVLVGVLGAEMRLQREFDRPWYELYDGEKPLVAGHHHYLGTGEPLIVNDRVFLIDTGCCRGGRLTGLLLPEFRLTSVPARRNYWKETAASARAAPQSLAPLKSLSWQEANELADLATEPESLLPAERDHAARARDLLARAEDALDQLLERITAETRRVVEGLKNSESYATLLPKEQARLFAEQVRDSVLAPLMHKARKGLLTREALKRHFGTPYRTVESVDREGR